MQDFMKKVCKSKQEGDFYPLFLRSRHIYTPYMVRRDEKPHDYNKNEKTVEILFISYLTIIITENTMNDYSKVSKH